MKRKFNAAGRDGPCMCHARYCLVWLAAMCLALAACSAVGSQTGDVQSTAVAVTAEASPSQPRPAGLAASPVPSAVSSEEPATAGVPAPSTTPTAGPSATPLPPPTATSALEVRLMAVGDLMLARSVGERIEADGPQAAFHQVVDIFDGADLLAGNLECVISDVGQPEPKAFVFRAPPAAAEALALAGFDVVSLANNHALDYGLEGLADMLPRLREAGVASVGAGADEVAARAPVILTRNGMRIAFLAYVDVPVEGRTGFDTRSWSAGPFTPGVAWAHVEQIKSDVVAARALADSVVVMMHFGLESRREVTAAQRQQAHAAVDAGAVLVLGAHTHVLQPVEEYNGGVIAYGLGNFVFDGFSMPSNYSAVFSAVLTPGGVASYEWVPVVVERGLPRPARQDEAAAILARVQTE